MNESLVVYSDLTQLDGEPTSRAIPLIERTPAPCGIKGGRGLIGTPVDRSDYEAAAALLVAVLLVATLRRWSRGRPSRRSASESAALCR